MTDERIERINELARKSRTPEGLNEAEREEQAKLRQEYRDAFKRSLSATLDTCVIMDEKGNKKKVQQRKKTNDN